MSPGLLGYDNSVIDDNNNIYGGSRLKTKWV